MPNQLAHALHTAGHTAARPMVLFYSRKKAECPGLLWTAVKVSWHVLGVGRRLYSLCYDNTSMLAHMRASRGQVDQTFLEMYCDGLALTFR
eukprot:6198019-Pleurochrysis_carterae.AAC.2